MKKTELSNLVIADLCRELSLLLRAGVALGDGLALLAEEAAEQEDKALLAGMAGSMEEGRTLSAAMEAAGCFPAYVTGLAAVGERTGRTEEALAALSRYYEEREALEQRVRSALTYPAILLVLMLAVIVLLLTQVLPVFDQVYASLGGRLTGVAGGLLLLGNALNAAMPFLCGVLLLVVLLAALFALRAGFRQKAVAFWRVRWGDKGMSRRLNDARFAQAMAMGMRSGLPLEEAVDLAAELLKETPAAVERCRECRTRLESGEDLASALGGAGVMPLPACRLLTLGIRSGSGGQRPGAAGRGGDRGAYCGGRRAVCRPGGLAGGERPWVKGNGHPCRR